MGEGAADGRRRRTLTTFRCRFPTPSGRCKRFVAGSGERCYQHRGLDAELAAREIAAALRDRRAAMGQRQRAVRARVSTVMSDEQMAALAECLNRHEVAYVIVGGAASQLHGAPVARTRDVDVVPAREAKNLDRLARALREIRARLWVGPDEPTGLAVTLDRTTLGAIDGFLNLVTRYGPVDITFVPDGTAGYADLAVSAVTVRLLDVDVRIAALKDVIRSKEAAGRDKDIAVLPDLIEFLRTQSGDVDDA